VLADIVKKPCYHAGGTLKLVLPFLKAHDVTDRQIHEFSAHNIILIKDTKQALQHICKIAPAFIVSTSYEHYMKELCKLIDFPYENTYCTRLNMDKYTIPDNEKKQLRQLADKIAHMPLFDIPPNAKALDDLPKEAQNTVERLDHVFWKQIAATQAGKIYDKVDPVGGIGKAEAVKDVVRKQGATLSDVIYVGDSITDEEAFKLVKQNDGLTVSFNGNRYAIDNADVAVMSETSLVTALVADTFIKHGKDAALRLAGNWSSDALQKSAADANLTRSILKLYPAELPKVKIITSQNIVTLAKESTRFREEVRGEAIGKLG